MEDEVVEVEEDEVQKENSAVVDDGSQSNDASDLSAVVCGLVDDPNAAEVELPEATYTTEEAATYQTGVWYYDSQAVQVAAYAKSNHLPLFYVYTGLVIDPSTGAILNYDSSKHCHQCKEWHDAVLNTTAVKNGIKTKNCYFCCLTYNYASGPNVIKQEVSQILGSWMSFNNYGYPYLILHNGYTSDSSKLVASYGCHPNAYCSSRYNFYTWVENGVKTSNKLILNTASDFLASIDKISTPPITYYTVTFKDWDGTVLKTETVANGSSATPPSTPVRDGYKFTGWSTSYTHVTSNLVVTAQYVQDMTDQKRKILDTYFLGLKHDCAMKMRDNVTLYYIYKYNNIFRYLDVSVSFNGNGSTSGSTSAVSTKIGQQWTCPSCGYSRSDHTFEGYWASSSDGSGTKYYPGTVYDAPLENLTLYAVWKATYKAGTYVVLASTETSPGCSKLTGMTNDINRVRNMLPSSVPSANIIELANSQCTTANIKKYLEIGKDYEFLIYLFSDHGGTGDNGVMCTYDGRFKSADFYDIVSRAKGRVFAIFACCHAEDQYKSTSPYLTDEAGNTVGEKSDVDTSFSDQVDKDGQYDWSQGAIEYFEELKKKKQEILDKIEQRKNTKLMAALLSDEEQAILAANDEPNMLCWCACKKSQVSYMSQNVGHYLITGLQKNFNSNLTYSAQWDAFANKTPAKGTTDGNTYTPVKAVLGTSFESRKVFT